MAPSSLQRINGAPHASTERFEQIPRNSRTRCNTNRRDRDGSVELAGRRCLPSVERSPLKKLAVDESASLKLLHRWREEAEQAGHSIKRIASPSRRVGCAFQASHAPPSVRLPPLSASHPAGPTGEQPQVPVMSQTRRSPCSWGGRLPKRLSLIF
jgi:hypothetical protein